MIVIKDLNKVYKTRSGNRTVLSHVNLTIERGEHIGILGRNGAGKSTLIRMLSGIEPPTSGSVERTMSISWPLAFGGAFQGSLSGLDNIRFICRIYGVPIAQAVDYVESFSELGVYLKEPVKKYSSGMRARLAFGISMAVDFDCFLIDEVVAVGDSYFQEKSRIELFEKRRDRSMIIVSHNADFIKNHCNRAVVLHKGELHTFDDVDQAYEFYQVFTTHI